MKISCQTCEAKYTIADEKVSGKVVKIKCRKCGSTIVVNGAEGGAAATSPSAIPPAVEASPEQAEAAAGANGDVRGGATSSGAQEWTVSVSDDDQRPMTTAQLVAEYHRGTLTNDTYVWKDGMTDWQAIADVRELVELLGPAAAASAPASQPAPAPAASGGFGLAASAPEPTPSATQAARRAGGRAMGGVDLFGPKSNPPPEPFAAAATSPVGPERLTGERNENSVLFSLSALTAAETAAKASKSSPPAAPFGASRPATRDNGRAAFDDIMNLGGGGIAPSPVLAPPPLLAPVVEPPPEVRPVSVRPVPSSLGTAAGVLAEPEKRSGAGPVIPIVLILLGVVVVGGVTMFFMNSGHKDVTPEQAPMSQTAQAVPPPQATPAPMPEPPPTASAADSASAEPASSAAPAESSTAVAARPAGPAGRPGPTPDKPAPEKPAAPTPTPAKTAEPTAGEGAGKEFNRGAAAAALGAIAGGVRSCKKPDGPTGGGRVKVTFAPSGRVTSAQVEGPPFAGTSVGGCVAGAFRSAHVPPFDGSPVTVSKSFSIN